MNLVCMCMSTVTNVAKIRHFQAASDIEVSES